MSSSENHTVSGHALVASSVMVVRVWSPVAVAVYSLALAFPASLVLAVKNWRALGMHKEAGRHLSGAFAVALCLIGLFLYLPARTARGFAVAFNFAAFYYLKGKLRFDEAVATKANPSLVIEYRRWYSGVPWALLGILVFILFAVVVVAALAGAGVSLPE